MTSYNMVLTPEFFGSVRRGAFDHWKGETMPVRGPDRRIIGEATVKDVDHRESGCVYVTIESELDLGETGLPGIAEVITGRTGMSFSVPHQPRRDDDVARWLKHNRDAYARLRCHGSAAAIDGLLNEYRARADYGLTLDDDISELEGRW